jgi:4-alpha-glucanotransferase
VLANGASVGAPPDEFNTEGQDWCLPPFVPHRLRSLRFGPFIDTLRASLRHAGGLRIDHVMGLFRLYWIPAGLGPKRGAYVQYAADELLAIVAVESHRAGAWVAGEDLGTVEKDVRRRLAENRMLSYRLLWFEDKRPDKYPKRSMAAITTHDLPTVAGIWSGYDMNARREIGLSADEESYAKIRKRLLAATTLSDDESPSEAIRKAYEALARAPSSVLVANLDDALAVSERPNMPGTVDEWPNWSLALPTLLEEIEEAALPAAIAKCLSRKV